MIRLLLLAAAVAFALPTLLAGAALPQSGAVARGVQFIRATQQPDGGFGGFGDGQTFDAVFAIRAAGIDPVSVRTGGKSPADFLHDRAATQTTTGAAAKAAMAAIAMNIDPHNVGGTDLAGRVRSGFNGSVYASDSFSHALAMIALTAAGEPVPPGARTGLMSMQETDGGWGFGGYSDADTTALAIQALLAAGGPAPEAAIAYLHGQQLPDGGWGFGESNANSTAFVVQAILALGQNPEGPEWTRGTATPVSYLLSQQQANGSFAGFDPAFATNQVVPALAGRTFLEAVTTTLTSGASPSLPSATPPPADTNVPTPSATVATSTAVPATATPSVTTPTATPTRPVNTPVPATATAPATPSASTTAATQPPATATPQGPPTVPPGAPQTGSGTGPGASETGLAPIAGVVLLLVAGSLMLASKRR